MRSNLTHVRGDGTFGVRPAPNGLVFSVLVLLSLLLSTSTQAAAPGSGATFDESNVNYDPGPPERRGGFEMGVSQGLGFGTYRGYPLEVAALNDPEQRQTTGPAVATQFNLWLGAALRDFLTFGVGASMMSTQGKQVGAQFALLVHIEAYPLFYKGGFFKDFGLSLDGGLGLGVILEREDGKPGDSVAEGGALSTIGAGVFWEPVKFWHFSMGPTVNYVYGFSQTMQAHQGTLGLRFVFYGTRPKSRARQDTSGSSGDVARLNWP